MHPCEPLPASPVAEHRVERGRSFEAELFAKLGSPARRAVVVDVRERAERELATAAAMRGGAAIVLGGRLPTDLAGRRAGEPDVLLRARVLPFYRAIDIKAHQTHDQALGGVEATCSALASPDPEVAEARPGRWACKRRADLLPIAPAPGSVRRQKRLAVQHRRSRDGSPREPMVGAASPAR